MRVFADKTYGVPPEQVMGSSGETQYQMVDESPVLMKLPKVEFIDDGPGKPVGINKFIGRRPILAFGNSDGDQQMLEWTAAGEGARFMGLVHHTDAVREYAYGPDSKVGTFSDALFAEANAKGWTVGPELLPPLSPSRAPRRADRHLDLPSRLPLHQTY